MVNLWNMKNLSLPPLCTYKANSCRDIDIEEFHNICDGFKNCYMKYPYFHSEYLLLSRIVYRMKQKFRTSKDFKTLEKLNKSLQRYFSTSLLVDLESLIDLMPQHYSNELYLPTKNLIDYILVKLQGLAKLLDYIIGTCVDIADMLNVRIHTGHFWKIGFILFSIISRIYVLSRHSIKTICDFYLKVLPFSKVLKNIGKVWLPENYIMPADLESWLEIDLSKIDQDIKKIQEPAAVPDVITYFNLVDDFDSDIEIVDNSMYESFKEEVIGNFGAIKTLQCPSKIPFSSIQKLHKRCNLSEDIGEVIEIMSNDNLELDNPITIITDDETSEQTKDCNSKMEKLLISNKVRKSKKSKLKVKTKLNIAESATSEIGNSSMIQENHSNKEKIIFKKKLLEKGKYKSKKKAKSKSIHGSKSQKSQLKVKTKLTITESTVSEIGNPSMIQKHLLNKEKVIFRKKLPEEVKYESKKKANSKSIHGSKSKKSKFEEKTKLTITESAVSNIGNSSMIQKHPFNKEKIIFKKKLPEKVQYKSKKKVNSKSIHGSKSEKSKLTVKTKLAISESSVSEIGNSSMIQKKLFNKEKIILKKKLPEKVRYKSKKKANSKSIYGSKNKTNKFKNMF